MIEGYFEYSSLILVKSCPFDAAPNPERQVMK
jgi:hypothetical protein